MSRRRLQRGDLAEIFLICDPEVPKRWAVVGRFSGSRREYVLARIGEGRDDPRDAAVVELTATRLLYEIRSLHSTMARLRADESQRGAA